MSDDKQVEATAGPYKGQRITMPAADADQAIADGWAIDPFAPVDPDAEPRVMSDEVIAAFEKALRKLRGEVESEPEKPAPKPPARPVQRDMKPADSPTYSTRHTSKRED